MQRHLHIYHCIIIFYNYLIPELPASICSRSQDTETIKGTAMIASFNVGGVTLVEVELTMQWATSGNN